ncbi:hypothetical protein HY971_01900 [Candidatus Kaiserbacteria bacterium]|nr:hypothetical protein [Candidatus Kaiserbacteria bacterium]
MTFATLMFLLSLLGVIALFSLKYWEIRSERVVLSALRQKADVRAQQLKELMDAARLDLAKLPPWALRLSRIGIHQLALGFAAFARTAESYAHQLADLVSYKHRFEKRDTSSEFLKKVAEHKNGNGLDTTGDNGHNT